MVSNKSRAFEVWCKGVMGTFLVTTVQYLCLGILFNVFGSVVKGTTQPMSIVLIVIGALLFIISSPSLVTTLLNANTGTMANFNELHSVMALGTSMVAMSKYGKTSDNSNNSNTNSDNSTTNNSSSSDGSDPNMTSNTSGSSSLESTNANSGSENTSDNSKNSSSTPSSPQDNSNYINDIPSMNNETSLNDRIDVYKDMTDSNYTLNHDKGFSYQTTIDWGKENNVFNTKEHKS